MKICPRLPSPKRESRRTPNFGLLSSDLESSSRNHSFYLRSHQQQLFITTFSSRMDDCQNQMICIINKVQEKLQTFCVTEFPGSADTPEKQSLIELKAFLVFCKFKLFNVLNTCSGVQVSLSVFGFVSLPLQKLLFQYL